MQSQTASAIAQAFEQLPPQALEAETILLGSMIVDNAVINDVVEVLDGDSFYLRKNKLVFDAIVRLFVDRKPIDAVILKDELERAGVLAEVGGAEYVGSLIDIVPSAANAVYYAGIIKDKSILRHISGLCHNLLREVMDAAGSPEDIIERAERMIFDTLRKRPTKNLAKISDILQEAFRAITNIRDNNRLIAGLPTKLYNLDEAISGLQGSNLIVIAGRPGMGKTSFAMRIIESIGVAQKKGVLFFSLEMNAQMITQIMLCSHCRMSYHNLRKGFISEEELQRMLIAAGKFQEAPIFIDDSSDLTLLDIRARARRLKAEYDIQLVVVDYLQLIQVKGAESRQQEIAMISKTLKALAKELDVPVITLAQLNRNVENRGEEHVPRLADLRESGAIEQDADVVMLLYRDEYYHPETTREKNMCKVIIAKNRTGPTTEFNMSFLKEFMRFENPAQGEEAPIE